MNRLKSKIESVYAFPAAEFNEFLALWTPSAGGKGQMILQAGAVASHIYFIESGAVRSFFIKDGREITEWIALDNNFIFSPTSLFSQAPSRISLQVVESSVLYSIRVEELEKWCTTSIHAAQFYRKMITNGLIAAEKRIEFLLTSSAVQRYRTLTVQFPDIVQRVPLSFIASYIGVTKETLSRVRGRKLPV